MIDLAKILCSMPISIGSQPQFSFTFSVIQYTFNWLPMRDLNSLPSHILFKQDLNCIRFFLGAGVTSHWWYRPLRKFLWHSYSEHMNTKELTKKGDKLLGKPRATQFLIVLRNSYWLFSIHNIKTSPTYFKLFWVLSKIYQFTNGVTMLLANCPTLNGAPPTKSSGLCPNCNITGTAVSVPHKLLHFGSLKVYSPVFWIL